MLQAQSENEISYSLGSTEYFSIDPSTGEILLNRALDYEQPEERNFTVGIYVASTKQEWEYTSVTNGVCRLG